MYRKTKRVLRTAHNKSKKSRRMRKTRKSRRIRGGSYAKDITVRTFQGIPVTKNAIITANGVSRNLSDFINYKEDQDEEGPDL